MKFLDLFAGIGGFRLGMERAGHECVGHVEIDKYANQSYRAIHQPKESEFFHDDITTITDESIRELRDRGIDIITGGFPCQAFSIAGKRAGFEDTRGTLFFDIARMARIIRPKYLFLENVKGLLNHDNGDTFETILRALDELGYDAEWQVLNSKHFGVPQNRERVFIIGHLRGERTRKVFPIGRESRSATENYIKPINDSKKTRELFKYDSSNRFYDISGISPCLNTMGGGGCGPKVAIPVLTPDRAEKRQNGRRFKEDGEPVFTITAQDRHGVLLAPDNWSHKAGDGTATRKHRETDIHPALAANPGSSQATYYKESNFRIRKLTPKECWRLQGFPDWAYERAKAAGVSDSQLYKQAGNAVTVNVIESIAKKLRIEKVHYPLTITEV